MDDRVQVAWAEFLNPDVLRTHLIGAAFYITTFEVLKESVIDRIRSFYGADQLGEVAELDYKREVLALNKSPVYASLEWLRSRGAVDVGDIETFSRVKDCRNTLAHRLFERIASEGMPAEFHTCFHEMVNLIHKIELWWIKEFEIPVDPEFDGKDIEDLAITPGVIVILRMMVDVAFGDDSVSKSYFEEFKRFTESG